MGSQELGEESLSSSLKEEKLQGDHHHLWDQPHSGVSCMPIGELEPVIRSWSRAGMCLGAHATVLIQRPAVIKKAD